MNHTIYEAEQFLIYRYGASLNRLYLSDVDEMYFQKKVRFLLNYISKGELYYMKDRVADITVGYCMISRGKAFRYSFAKPEDITLGPIFIKPEYRGKRLSVLLLRNVIRQYLDGGNAYAYIRRTNTPSIALFSGTGFQPICGAKTGRIAKRVYCSQNPDSEYQLFRLTLADYQENVTNKD